MNTNILNSMKDIITIEDIIDLYFKKGIGLLIENGDFSFINLKSE